jgi:hypothetical protein
LGNCAGLHQPSTSLLIGSGLHPSGARRRHFTRLRCYCVRVVRGIDLQQCLTAFDQLAGIHQAPRNFSGDAKAETALNSGGDDTGVGALKVLRRPHLGDVDETREEAWISLGLLLRARRKGHGERRKNEMELRHTPSADVATRGQASLSELVRGAG